MILWTFIFRTSSHSVDRSAGADNLHSPNDARW